MKNKILIGEMAKLHNISTQTLRYYDKIGLFKPRHVDENNGYRYYDIEQCGNLDSILFLKNLGMPLEEIENYFKNRNLSSIKDVLKNQQERLEEEIKILKERSTAIDNKVNALEFYTDSKNLNVPILKEIDERYMVYINFKKGGTIELEYGIKALSNLVMDDLSLFKGSITCIIDKSNLHKKNYDYWKAVALVFNKDFVCNNKSKLKTITKDNFATIVFRGGINSGEKYYKKLLDYIYIKNLKINGDGLIMTISDISYSSYEDDYIYEIQIPVIKP